MDSERKDAALDASTIVLLTALVFGLFRQGAYHEWQHTVFAVLVAAAGVLRLSSSAGRSALARSAVVAAPLFGSSALSLLVSADRSDAGSTFVTLALCTVALSVGMAVRPGSRRLAGDVLLATTTIVAATAVHGVASHSTPWGRVTGDMWRGSSSITYANAAAAVLAMALTLALWRAIRSDSRLHAAATTFAGIALLSTQSRAGLLALLLVVPLSSLRLGVLPAVRAGLPIVAGTVVGAGLLIRLAPVSATPQPVLAWAGVALGVALTWWLWPQRLRIDRPVPFLAAATVMAVLSILLSPLRDRVTLSSATTASGPGGSVMFGDRGRLWGSAWDRFVEQPLVGHGPGHVDLRWSEDGGTFVAEFVHNEYLELLVTHGLIGLLALAASGFLLVRHTASDGAVGGLLVAGTVFLVHSTLDFFWHIPVLPVMACLVLGLARTAPIETMAPRPTDQRTHTPRAQE